MVRRKVPQEKLNFMNENLLRTTNLWVPAPLPPPHSSTTVPHRLLVKMASLSVKIANNQII